MLYGSNFILNSADTKNQFTIYPFIHSPDYYYSEDDMYRSITVPCKVASEVVSSNANFSIASGEFIDVYGNIK